MDAEIEVPVDQFINLSARLTATMLVLSTSLGLTKNATLTIYEVNSLGSRTGLRLFGNVAAVAAGEFFSVPVGFNPYYITNLRMPSWTDYSASTTVVGFASINTKQVWYYSDGATLYWIARIQGTSNAGNLTFTLPTAQKASTPPCTIACAVTNSGAPVTSGGRCLTAASSAVISVFSNLSNGTFAATGTKAVFAEGFYIIN